MYSIDEGCLDENDNETNLTSIYAPGDDGVHVEWATAARPSRILRDTASDHFHGLLNELELDAWTGARTGASMRRDELWSIESERVQAEQTSFFVTA